MPCIRTIPSANEARYQARDRDPVLGVERVLGAGRGRSSIKGVERRSRKRRDAGRRMKSGRRGEVGGTSPPRPSFDLWFTTGRHGNPQRPTSQHITGRAFHSVRRTELLAGPGTGSKPLGASQVRAADSAGRACWHGRRSCNPGMQRRRSRRHPTPRASGAALADSLTAVSQPPPADPPGSTPPPEPDGRGGRREQRDRPARGRAGPARRRRHPQRSPREAAAEPGDDQPRLGARDRLLRRRRRWRPAPSPGSGPPPSASSSSS